MNHIYEDNRGVLHSCESTEAHRGIVLVWTKCDKDVPSNESFLSLEKPNCSACSSTSPPLPPS
jgi:hypothetical protein